MAKNNEDRLFVYNGVTVKDVPSEMVTDKDKYKKFLLSEGWQQTKDMKLISQYYEFEETKQEKPTEGSKKEKKKKEAKVQKEVKPPNEEAV